MAGPDDASADRPDTLQARAADNLRYIRETMERAGSFTAVPGWGGVAMGFVALAAAAVAVHQREPRAWLETWFVAAAVALLAGGWAMDRKARKAGVGLMSGVARRFAFGLLPPLAAGAMLTLVLARMDLIGLLPGTWLLLYGVAVVTAGISSIRVVPLLGLAFMLLGAAALLAPAWLGNVFLAAGFGGLQIGFGLVIARRHGG
jgi:hypothetical protein